MGHRLLQVTLNHAQRRVKRPRIGITARGTDWAESPGLTVCPATGAVRLPANFEMPEFQTTNEGVYRKLALADWDFTDTNTSPVSPAWASIGFDHPDQMVQYIGGENLTGAGGVGAVSVESYEADQAWAFGAFAYSSGTDQDGILAEIGWNSAISGDAGPSIRFYFDGSLQVWHDGGDRPVETASLSGTAGYSRATTRYVLFTIERGRGRDMIIRTSTGGAVAIRCPWVDPEDTDSHMFPATNFWWRIPKGGATVMACPIVYAETGEGDTRVYVHGEAPGEDEVLADWTGSDRFPEVDNAHLVGHPQGGTAAVSIRNEDGTLFVPDGETRRCRVRLTLSAGNSGRTSPWIWGLHAAYPPIVVTTADAEINIGPILASPVRLELPDSHEGLSAMFEGVDPVALDALAPHTSDGEATPIRIDLVDPDEIDPVTLLDGELRPIELADAFRRQAARMSFKAVDVLAGASDAKAKEALPFDGMPFCEPVESGVSAVLVCLRELGLADDSIQLPSLGYRLPDVPSNGASRSVAGDWNMAANGGDLWVAVLERLFSRAPAIVWGMRPLAPGSYGFRAFEPADTDVPIATLYRTVAAAQVAFPELSIEEAARLLYDGNKTTPLPLEGNEVRVTGLDPGKQAPIAALAIWHESADPETAPIDRFRGWIGKRRDVEYTDPGLTTIEDCSRVCENIYNEVAAARDLDPYVSHLPFTEDGVPLWRGELVTLDDHQDSGAPRNVRTSSWSVVLKDESGKGYMAGEELPPSRMASICGGALLGYGGVGAFEIFNLADERSRAARRFKGFGDIPAVSHSEIAYLS